MTCGERTEVVETTLRSDGAIRRRRECLACHHRFSTIEQAPVSELAAASSSPVVPERKP